jgi:CDP-diglyceride synthetase
LPKWTRFLFVLLFFLSLIWICYFIAKELCYLYFKFEKKSFLIIYFILLLVSIVLPSSFLFLSVFKYFNLSLIGDDNKIFAYIYVSILVILPLICLSILIIFVQNNNLNLSNFNLKNFPLTFLIISYAFNLIFYISTVWGFASLICVLAISILSDVGGLITGVFFGKHKMAPKISPKKTWEGAIGGQIFSVSILLTFFAIINIYADYSNNSNSNLFSRIERNFFGNQFFPGTTLNFHSQQWEWWIIAFFIVLGIGISSIFGDLYFSLLKRKNDIKDYANYFPGHGGFLDRIDSWIFAFLFYGFIIISCSTISSIIHANTGWNSIFNYQFV